MYHSWFLVYQRVLPPLHLHVLLHHLHHRILHLTTETLKIQYQKEVEVRMKSFGETRCMNQQKPKSKIKMKDAKKNRAIYHMNCRIGYKNSQRIWSMNVVRQSHGETLSMDVEILPILPMNCQCSGKHSVYTHFPKDPNCDICLKTKITRASCRRRAGTVVPKAKNW